METIKAGGVDIRNWATDLDDDTRLQLGALSRLPIISDSVAAMPDAHIGAGAAVGSVIVTRNALIPSAVGSDIGCGMMAVKTSLHASDLPDSLSKIRAGIEKAIPLGSAAKHNDESHLSRHGSARHLLKDDPRLGVVMEAADGKSQRYASKIVGQMGTLGSGNHFIEVCLDESDALWVMLHSGSRAAGGVVGDQFVSLAMNMMASRNHKLEDPYLAWLEAGEKAFDDYWKAMSWAQEFAMLNRSIMMDITLSSIRKHLGPFIASEMAINCHHNYANLETHDGQQVYVTRKGAIRADKDRYGIIPGSMGAKSYIVRGLGNDESWCSCSHGAGRAMSRSAAKKAFTQEDVVAQTHGVECRKDRGVIDEIPGAYKDIDQVMANQKDLVEIVHTLKQIVCVKG